MAGTQGTDCIYTHLSSPFLFHLCDANEHVFLSDQFISYFCFVNFIALPRQIVSVPYPCAVTYTINIVRKSNKNRHNFR